MASLSSQRAIRPSTPVDKVMESFYIFVPCSVAACDWGMISKNFLWNNEKAANKCDTF